MGNVFAKKTKHHALWLYYSQNIAFKEKRQLQSAQFSGKQHTLHNTIIQTPNSGKITNAYHILDDMTT